MKAIHLAVSVTEISVMGFSLRHRCPPLHEGEGRPIFPLSERTLRSSRLPMCKGKQCAALLLDALIDCTQAMTAEEHDLWPHISQEHLYEAILHLADKRVMSRDLQELEHKSAFQG